LLLVTTAVLYIYECKYIVAVQPNVTVNAASWQANLHLAVY